MVKQRFGCIYRLTNLITKRAYIGKTVNFKQRMGQHKHRSKKGKTYLYNSINRHGWENFKKEIIIDDVPEEDLSNLEISYIEVENTMFPQGYNLTLGGEGSNGFKHTEEAREKCRQATILRAANRNRIGSVTFAKIFNKFRAVGPGPDYKSIGYYFTREKAEQSLRQFNERGKILESDRLKRKYGTGTIYKSKNGKRYVAAQKTKNKKKISKTFDTKEECEEWLKTKLNF